ncbi:type I methionyl aminopeptidase [bacterium]|nr:type I methionyl aminopeptidase [bacterium]
MIELKSIKEFEIMRESGRLAARVLEHLEDKVKPGIQTRELDSIAYKFIKKHGATPSFLGYRGFPATLCISINEEIVHGIPSRRKLEDGDIVKIDVGVFKNGYHGDTAYTYKVGQISDVADKLVEVTRECLKRGIAAAKCSGWSGDIGHAIQTYAESNSFSVIRDFVGHGIGKKLHESPQVPHYGEPKTGFILREGMVFSIEPMINEGHYDVKFLDDGWTAVTADGSLSAQFEHVVYIGKYKTEILTEP